MKQQQFVTGQRWVSDAEAELGLGVVLEVENRRLTLSFPASGERRTYAIDEAPISRVRYHVDEKCAIRTAPALLLSKYWSRVTCWPTEA